MLSRQNLITLFKRTEFDLDTYIDFCKLLEIYNDLVFSFNQTVLYNSSNNLIKELLCYFFKNTDIEALLNIYPVYIKEHTHLFLAAKTVGIPIDVSKLIALYNQDIIQKNEFELNWFTTLHCQLNFLTNEINSYRIDVTKVRTRRFSYDCLRFLNNNFLTLEQYREIIVKTELANNTIFSPILLDLLEELSYDT
ncbi:hypothetical protein GGG87_02010 [Streptococcus sp. zg-86]|uniref:Uncharacterized protein n=1 Tax=Streptococcus zhangguiae TaxID=2664091 RepID=A0A6I4R899_9STRE|nr:MULTISPECIES: hypothetical protein [unclassified Streptococcus]MTB63787.1 hypothetical protein [Streptococcus sp. zg-86]MTB90097.1 hypothetical protein [Streptococcus sp. zg-36]MWV55769.1 hypothetical protein [Streptococcus sp. zg-70]QTH47945.1 hypothetical protein J5M87_00990 [Streptococcus sp. zg-86]